MGEEFRESGAGIAKEGNRGHQLFADQPSRVLQKGIAL
jgi:hypothetical protein